MKWLNYKCSLYRAHKVLYTECHSWPLTLWPKINRVPPLIINNLRVMFENDGVKTDCSLHRAQGFAHKKCKSWPLTQNLLDTCIINMWSLKVIGQKLHAVCIVTTWFLFTECQSWPWLQKDCLCHVCSPWPKSNGFLLSSQAIYIWSLKSDRVKIVVYIMSIRFYKERIKFDLEL